MSENEIKPVAWIDREYFEFFSEKDEGSEPLYDQSAIDRLTAELTLASGEQNRLQLKWDEFRKTKNTEVQRLTAERDAALQSRDRFWDERDAAVADASSLRERMLALEAQRDEFGSREWQAEKGRRKAVAAVNIAYRHIDVESLRVSHCKDLATIEAAMAEAK